MYLHIYLIYLYICMFNDFEGNYHIYSLVFWNTTRFDNYYIPTLLINAIFLDKIIIVDIHPCCHTLTVLLNIVSLALLYFYK